MTCHISYQRGEATGFLDFGIKDPDDPEIASECARLRAEGCIITKVWIT